LKILITRKYVVEVPLGRAFRDLGHEVLLERVPTGAKMSRIVQSFEPDIVITPSNSPLGKLDDTIQSLRGKKTIFCYWERRWPKVYNKSRNPNEIFDVVFTVYNDNSGHLLPCCAEDHSSLKEDNRYGVTLVARDKSNYRAPLRKTRRDLHKRITKDLAQEYTIYGEIDPYNNRFKYMANSEFSIGIWNATHGAPLRLFEIISCKTPLIMYPYPEFRNYFTPGKHYIETNSLKRSIDYYRKHPGELETIVEAGYQHLLKYHTYHQRAQEIVDVVTKSLRN